MCIRRQLLAIPLLLAASAMPALGDVRDKAGLFSRDAIQKAEAELSRIERETKIPVTIETIPSLNGVPIDQALPQHAKQDGVRGLFVLIAKEEGKISAESSREYHHYFSRPQYQSIYEAFEPGFRKRDFDAGLQQGITHLATVLPVIAKAVSTAPAIHAQAPRPQAPAPVRVPAQARSGMSSLIGIVLLVVGGLIVFRIIGAMMKAGRGGGYGPGYGPGQMRGPGYGPGPGYGGGGGGGGFMSSLFGGIGGALAGNWLYDQFGRHHGADPTTYAPGSEAVPPADAGPDWQGAGDGGGDWGGGGGDTGGGGGDWGAGGGGDWGGGGGGDWGGGGGGGDWGGGGDGGGSW